MTMKPRLIILIILVGLYALTSHGQQTTEIKVPKDGLKTKEQRTEFAKQLIAYFQHVDDQIPNLKPDLKEWVESEGDRLFWMKNSEEKDKQQLRLRASWEWKVWRIKKDLSRFKELLTGIVNEDYLAGFAIRTNRVPRMSYRVEAEMRSWVGFSQTFTMIDTFQFMWEDRLIGGEKWPFAPLTIGNYGGLRTPTVTILASIDVYILDSYFQARLKEKDDLELRQILEREGKNKVDPEEVKPTK